MAEDTDLAAEIAALRAELNALRDEQARSTSAVSQTSANSSSGAASMSGERPTEFFDHQLKEFEAAVKELAEAVETEVANRPVVAVGAAFLLGIMLGRLTSR